MINVTKADLPELKEYIKYLKKIWSSRWLTNNGEFVQLLEKKLEEYLGVKNLILVANGTLGLQLALKALDIQGEVITTPFTFPSTTNAILWERLVPIFADVDSETFNLNPKEVEKKIGEKTRAILATHVYGNPCYVVELNEIAHKYKLKLIYDAAHTFGVEYKSQSVLKYGDISILSFHATKIFNTIEGGAIVAEDEALFKKLKLLRNHGIKSEEEVVVPGINAKMNEFQAAMGLCNLENIDENIGLRRRLYKRYLEQLGTNNNLRFQKIIASKYNYIYMPVCFESIEKRDEIYSELINNGIKPRKYFYPLTPNFDYFNTKGINLVEKYDLQEADDIADTILCLPLYSDLELETVDEISRLILSLL